MQTTDDILKTQARCISHEIRNQVSICDVYCEIIRKHLQKNNVSLPPVDNALNCILKSLKMVSNSLLDLKSLSNIECNIFDLKELLLQGIELSKVYVYDKNIDITLECKSDCCVSVDENKFLAVLVNLIKNAIEAIEETGFINVKTEIEEDVASVKIFNNGERIPDDLTGKIFDEGLTTKCYGSGLGLYICKNNLQKMGADLNLIKSTDEITEFEITLPLKVS